MAFIELVVEGIREAIMTRQDVLVLKEKNGKRYLPIMIGRHEADDIAIKLQNNMGLLRPLTHDLLFNVIQLMECKLLSALISDLRDDCWYAYLIIERKKKKYSVDCRPSDAVAMAIKTMAPIFTTEEIMDKAAVIFSEEGNNVSKQPNIYIDHFNRPYR
jgi:bifunctional DNase/RNase